ncbi:E3 ubiquitin-protein ligase ZFP91 isoform X2 [Bufo bufo]|uniref:E3 ubiquitin-protein ligase ZFP91 isoform X2 n=1 Tax=Bufo bufo TaxID=8384 RepID=UPI001ABDE7CF|nr:E3 ubiquitin-protein ligase ZFP91 isoform X2 [Bufo bufo]
MPGGPEPRGRPRRAAGAEGAAVEDEVITGGSSRRRKAECPRRRRSRREMPGEEEALGLGGRHSYLEEDMLANKEINEGPSSYTAGISDEEEEDEDVLISEEETPYKDDPTDETYRPPHIESEDDDDDDDEEELISEEEIGYKDDPRDKSYRPQLNRSSTGSRRRGPRTREETAPVEVKMEVKEENPVPEPEAPRKRGRRRKDDKSPRLPKRRKKPPLQYVRCEMEGCGTVLAHPRYLQHHIKYQHLLKKKYVCPQPSCGRLFRLQKQLMRHAKHHTDQRDYICEYCARAFKSSHNLAVHRMIHTGEKPLQCEFCGFTCRQKASLNWHMKKHDADSFYQFSCGICGKKFEKKDSVVAHKAKSHPEILIAEALAANSGSLITTNNELLVTESSATTAPSVQDELAPPETFHSTHGSKVLVACSAPPAGGLGATTEVLIEDSDSAGP